MSATAVEPVTSAVATSASLPTLPRLADLAAVTPFAERWRVAREMHATAVSVLAAVERAVRAHGGPYSTGWPDGFLEVAWTRCLACELLACDRSSYTAIGDVAAFWQACDSLTDAVDWMNERDGYTSPEWFNSIVEKAAGGDSRSLDYLGRLLRDFRENRYDLDEWGRPDVPETVSGLMMSAMRTVWQSLPHIASGQSIPAHPQTRQRSIGACLSDLYEWIVSIGQHVGGATYHMPANVTEGSRLLASAHLQPVISVDGTALLEPPDGPTPDGGFRVRGQCTPPLGDKQITLLRTLWDASAGRPIEGGVNRRTVFSSVYGPLEPFNENKLSTLQRDTKAAVSTFVPGMEVRAVPKREGWMRLVLPVGKSGHSGETSSHVRDKNGMKKGMTAF